jgi:hypothetical protein
MAKSARRIPADPGGQRCEGFKKGRVAAMQAQQQQCISAPQIRDEDWRRRMWEHFLIVASAIPVGAESRRRRLRGVCVHSLQCPMFDRCSAGPDSAGSDQLDQEERKLETKRFA